MCRWTNLWTETVLLCNALGCAGWRRTDVSTCVCMCVCRIVLEGNRAVLCVRHKTCPHPRAQTTRGANDLDPGGRFPWPLYPRNTTESLRRRRKWVETPGGACRRDFCMTSPTAAVSRTCKCRVFLEVSGATLSFCVFHLPAPATQVSPNAWLRPLRPISKLGARWRHCAVSLTQSQMDDATLTQPGCNERPTCLHCPFCHGVEETHREQWNRTRTRVNSDVPVPQGWRWACVSWHTGTASTVTTERGKMHTNSSHCIHLRLSPHIKRHGQRHLLQHKDWQYGDVACCAHFLWTA